MDEFISVESQGRSYKVTTSQQRLVQIAQFIHYHTGSNLDLYRLAGRNNARSRQDVIYALEGDSRRSLNQCGIGVVRDLISAAFSVTQWTCEADREEQLKVALRCFLQPKE